MREDLTGDKSTASVVRVSMIRLSPLENICTFFLVDLAIPVGLEPTLLQIRILLPYPLGDGTKIESRK